MSGVRGHRLASPDLLHHPAGAGELIMSSWKKDLIAATLLGIAAGSVTGALVLHVALPDEQRPLVLVVSSVIGGLVMAWIFSRTWRSRP